MPNGSRSTLGSDTQLTLVTLGAAALRVSSSPGSDPGAAVPDATLFELGKPLALITYLICAPERSAPREHLIDLLWGDVEPEAAKHALRQTLWYIRKRLGERPLISGGDVLTIVATVECDRCRFVDAVAHGGAEEVVRLYTGEFFPGFAAPGGAEFERWADLERQRLRAFFWRSADVLVRQWMSAGRLREAQALARRVRDSDTLREAGWRLLFETLIASGDTIGGALEADAFDRLAAAEGLEPEASTRSMLRAVRQAPFSSGDARPDRPSLVAELVGREHEFSQLLASWEAARAGRATHVHVVAPAGLGKTRLITDVNARLRATRARTIMVRASLGAREIPFGLAGDLAESLATLPGGSGISTGSARALVALNPALSASYPAATPDGVGDSADTLRRRTLAIRELILAVAEEQPVAIFIDDVQWADSRSRQLVASIVGQLENARVMIVTASRPTVDALTAPERSQTIRLIPLDVAGVSALMASIAALPAEPWAERLPAEIHAATGGSPLLVLETLQLGIDGGLLVRSESGWGSPRPSRLVTSLTAGGALRQRVERLDRPERWVLTLLAVMGVPSQTSTIVAAGGRNADETTVALGDLERRGLVARHGDLWMPSHDEIAAMVTDLASPEARASAARALGRVLLDKHLNDMRELRHAGSLLAAAGDKPSLTVAFVRFARLARHAGDRQSNGSLAADYLGERRDASLTRQLVAALPVSHRVGLYSGHRQAFAAIAVLLMVLGAMGATLLRDRTTPDVVLAIGEVGLDSAARLYRVPIWSARLGAASRVPIGTRSPEWRLRMDPSYLSVVRRPDGGAWTLERVMPDSGGIEIIEVTDDGTERRLTTARGDDQGWTWSPDGRQAVFVTARWNPQSHYDLAIADAKTGAAHPLTSGADTDGSPRWSPDGSRISFTRRYWNGRSSQTCVVDVDGSRLRCFGKPTETMESARAWYDPSHLVVKFGSGGRRYLGRLNVDRGHVDTLAALPGNEDPHVSPDGRWVACKCRRINFAPSALLLFPLDDPNRIVELDLSSLNGSHLIVSFEPNSSRPPYAERLIFDHGLGHPMAGVAHLLKASGISASGDTIHVGSVRWSTTDTTIATIDSSGTLYARRPGRVGIRATAGGWRSTEQELEVRAPVSSTLFRETWADGITRSWTPYGDPRPVLDSVRPGLIAFRNNGEGSFSSGAYSRELFPTAGGLAADFWVSHRLTKDQWQIIHLSLENAFDDTLLRQWDHTYGGVPRTIVDWPRCGFGFPTTEGITYGDSLTALVGYDDKRVSVDAPRSFRTAEWFHVRLQIFPDGRCGVAVNGIAVAHSSERAIPHSQVRVLIGGNSAETKVLVGPTTIRTGVPGDIDWGRVGTPIPASPPEGWSPEMVFPPRS